MSNFLIVVDLKPIFSTIPSIIPSTRIQSPILNFFSTKTNIPEIKGYLETRPELIGVAEKPQLIIAGKAHPTGVQKT